MDIISIIETSSLFLGLNKTDIEQILKSSNISTSSYNKGQYIYSMGETLLQMGMVIVGGVHIVKDDFWGNRTIMTKLNPKELFAEAFYCAGMKSIPVSVVATSSTTVLFINYFEVMQMKLLTSVAKETLQRNMIKILANKNVNLTQKMEHITKRKTRDKLLSYLSTQAAKVEGNKFVIPFNRNELAEYLAVDRSAMSNELSKMQSEGMIEYQKNVFVLKKV